MPALDLVLAEPDCGEAVALVNCGQSPYGRRKFKENITRVPSFCRKQLWLMPALVDAGFRSRLGRAYLYRGNQK